MTRYLFLATTLYLGMTAGLSASEPWAGTWFTCEFAKSQTPASRCLRHVR